MVTDNSPFVSDISEAETLTEVERNDLSDLGSDIYALLLEHQQHFDHYCECLLFAGEGPLPALPNDGQLEGWLNEQGKGNELADRMRKAYAALHDDLLSSGRKGRFTRSDYHHANRLNRCFIELMLKYRDTVTNLWSVLDPLTGVFRREAMDLLIKQHHAMVQRGYYVSALAMLDLDCFKKINDQYGHQAGDEVLRQVGRHLWGSSRSQDAVFRYGGEEFLMCMPRTNLRKAKKRLERLRASIAKISIPVNQASLSITVSIGCCELSGERSIQESIGKVDQALYLAKSKGRNCLVIHR